MECAVDEKVEDKVALLVSLHELSLLSLALTVEVCHWFLGDELEDDTSPEKEDR